VTSAATVDEHAARSPLGVGVVIWLASELMFFGGLFAAYFALKSENGSAWPPSGAELDVPRTAVFTLVLVLSSVTMHLSVRSADQRKRQPALAWLLLTIVMGTMFIANQFFEWRSLAFQVDSHSYGTIYYTLTGFHGLHVIGGLVALAIVAWVVFSRYSRLPSTQTLHAVGYYWHFVDVVWIVVFLVVYVLR
jgi:cytochrome c oxidase subunit 3